MGLDLVLAYLYAFQNVHVTNITKAGLFIDSGLFRVDWEFAVDNLTLVMFLVVITVSTVVHIYSTDYLFFDPHLPRFLAYLSLFTVFMLFLVGSSNMIGMFLGWEGVGLCSYLLISFWFTRINAVKSATKAIIVNRVGDFGLTIGLCLVFMIFQSVDFAVFLGTSSFFSNAVIQIIWWDFAIMDTIALLLFIGAMAKSAQLALHTWLPDAMEGPTPVSALIHAATMVTAGVFLVIKTSAIFEETPTVLLIVTIVGSLTCFFAATSGLVQSDIKKVIAYSTCSQLGYMFFICGLSGYNIGLFHLSNHAFFKALLFLTAGAIIHSVANEQDMRRFGGLLYTLPVTYVLLAVGSIALMGFPFLTGYYSKDLIIEYAFAKYENSGSAAALLGILTAGITSFYSMRLVFLTFLTTATNVHRSALAKVHELSNKMLLCLIPLILGSIFLGYIAKDLFVGVGTNFWNNSIVISQTNNTLVEAEFTPLYIKFVPFIISIFAVIPLIINYAIMDNRFVWSWWKVQRLYNFLVYKWYVDVVYNWYITIPVLKMSYRSLFKTVDKGLVEYLGPTSYSLLINDISRWVVRSQSGSAPRYAMYTVQMLGLVLLLYIVL